MAGEAGTIKKDPLFVGLTRPTLFFGVSLPFFILILMFCAIYYIMTPSLYIILMGFSMYTIAYIICFKEPLFLELYMIKSQNFGDCPNKFYHGANSYDMS